MTSRPVPSPVLLTAQQVAAMRRELTTALEQLDTLHHLCSIQEFATRADEAISTALHILDAAAAGDVTSPPDGTLKS